MRPLSHILIVKLDFLTGLLLAYALQVLDMVLRLAIDVLGRGATLF